MPGEADDGGTPARREIAERMQHKSKVGFRLGCQHTGRCKAVVVDERGVVAAHPVYRIRRIGDNGIERLFVAILRMEERVAQGNVELIEIDVVQKHVHARQIISGMVDFLPEEAILYQMIVKLLLGLQQ